MKIFSIILIAVLLSMTGCQSYTYSEFPSLTVTEADLCTSDTSGYTDIVSDYKKLVSYRLSDNFEQQWNDDEYISESQSLMNSKSDMDGVRTTHGVNLEAKWSYMIVDMIDGLEDPSVGAFGYFFADINGDSVPELFWIRNDKTLLAIFTICDSNVVLLDTFYSRYKCVVTPLWEIYTFADGGVSNQYDIRLLSADGTLEVVHSFGTEGKSNGVGVQYFESKDNRKILVNETYWQRLLAYNPFEFGPEWHKLQIDWLV